MKDARWIRAARTGRITGVDETKKQADTGDAGCLAIVLALALAGVWFWLSGGDIQI